MSARFPDPRPCYVPPAAIARLPRGRIVSNAGWIWIALAAQAAIFAGILAAVLA